MKQAVHTDRMSSHKKKMNTSKFPAKPELKRDRHVETERRKRMRYALEKMESCLPKKSGPKRTTADIVEDAVVYIRTLQNHNAILIEKAIEQKQ